MLKLWISETPASLVMLLVTALGFLLYGFQVFLSPFTKGEFKRFGMNVVQRNTTGIIQILGAIALVIGIYYPTLGLLAAFGFTIMMCSALFVRIKLKDSLRVSLPALILLLSSMWLCISFYSWINH